MPNDLANRPCVWVVGYPRSGNTWASYLVSYCLNLPFVDFDAPSKQPKQEWVRRAVSGNHEWQSPAPYDSVRKTHKLPHQLSYRDGCVVYIQRDPRDVFVSYSYYLQNGAANWKRLRHQMLGALGKSMQIRWFIRDWKQHVEAWQRHTDLILHYEKLLSEGPGYLSGCFASAGFEVSEAIASSAMECFRFENMTGGRTSGKEDEKSFFRRGIAGDWRNHLNDEDNDLFMQTLAASDA